MPTTTPTTSSGAVSIPGRVPFPDGWSIADLIDHLGGIPAERVLLIPLPGTATEADLLRFVGGEPKRLCELVDGVLVEKPMGAFESRLVSVLIYFIEVYLETNDVAFLYGPDAPIRMSESIRLPDISIVRWEQVPDHRVPRDRIAEVYPDLTVEVLSRSNTRAEMAAKRELYFQCGTKIAWEIDPDAQTVASSRGRPRRSRSCLASMTRLRAVTFCQGSLWNCDDSLNALPAEWADELGASNLIPTRYSSV